MRQLLGQAARFELSAEHALQVLADVRRVVQGWRTVASGADVGLTASELDDFAPAFEHAAPGA